MMMKLPILPCAEKLQLVLSTAPKTSDNTEVLHVELLSDPSDQRDHTKALTHTISDCVKTSRPSVRLTTGAKINKKKVMQKFKKRQTVR